MVERAVIDELGDTPLKCFDNNDTVSYGFKRFHSKMKLLNGK